MQEYIKMLPEERNDEIPATDEQKKLIDEALIFCSNVEPREYIPFF
uniref:Uncharacterized protein n=1 Tax=Pithovirus LCPAC403 TaxID=2506596 RepID=A0A481ZE29_9VIRU|nr:MAG: hypothetical protein LCPAC403_04130 [Pithovirus LCPAC403]